jgi:hypothetical protein
MTDWWWKVGFTPRATRHVTPTGSFYAQVISAATPGYQASKLPAGGILWEQRRILWD